MSQALFATLESVRLVEPTRRKPLRKSPLELALPEICGEFSWCSVDGYKEQVRRESAEKAGQIQEMRWRHQCDTVRRNEYLKHSAGPLAIGAGTALVLVLAVFCLNQRYDLDPRTKAFGMQIALVAGLVAAFATYLNILLFKLKWTQDVSKWRSAVYLIPFVAWIVGSILDYRGVRRPYLTWEITPLEQFDTTSMPQEVLQLIAKIRKACPSVTFRIHHTVINWEQTPTNELNYEAYLAIDPFVEVSDGERNAVVAVYDESGFRLA
jgi:hypothetical protein